MDLPENRGSGVAPPPWPMDEPAQRSASGTLEGLSRTAAIGRWGQFVVDRPTASPDHPKPAFGLLKADVHEVSCARGGTHAVARSTAIRPSPRLRAAASGDPLADELFEHGERHRAVVDSDRMKILDVEAGPERRFGARAQLANLLVAQQVA